jgi:hypothetical protein
LYYFGSLSISEGPKIRSEKVAIVKAINETYLLGVFLKTIVTNGEAPA